MESLVQSKRATQRELQHELSASRTTISRSLRSLTDKHWLEKSGGEYRLTRAGRIVAEEIVRMLETVDAVEELSEFLRWFPASVDPPDFLDANDVEVTYSTDAAPYAPARKQTRILHAAEQLRILLPATDLDSTKTVAEQVTAGGLEVETVVSPGVESTLESEEFAPLVRDVMQTGRFPMFVVQESLPFYLCLADGGRIQIGLADEEGFPRALLETTDENVRTWAEGLYRGYRDRGVRKGPEEF